MAGTTNGENRQPARLGDMSMLIVVISAPGNRAQRETIRRTWMRRVAKIAPRWKVVFVVGRPGQPTAIEADTLWLDLEEAYEHLPRKTHATIRWFVETGGYDYIFKTDDDCYVNGWELARYVPGELGYFGGASGNKRHKPDYHFGRTTKEAVLDTSAYLGPWASGSGYCLSRAAAQKVVSRLTPEQTEQLVFEDKMIGDAMRGTDVPWQLVTKWGALTLDAFAAYSLNADGYVVGPRLKLPLRPLVPQWRVYHLGSVGGAKPLYRVDADAIGRIARTLDQALGWRALLKTGRTLIGGAGK